MGPISLFFLVIVHSLLAAFAVTVAVFYLFPHEFYFATPAYAATFLLFAATTYLVPAGSRLLPFKDKYLELLVTRPRLSWTVTGLIIALASAWTLVMFDSIYSRYNYMKAMDEALSSIGVDGITPPQPMLLAKAFNAAPDRPEVPFVLIRASRLISIDLLSPVFGKYNKAFLDAIDRPAILKKYNKFNPRHRIAIGNDNSNLPKIDPVRFLTFVAFETNVADEQKWAIDTLSDLRGGNLAADIQIAIWKDYMLGQHVPDETSIQAFDALLNSISSADFKSVPVVGDHIFQQGLDYISSMKIALQSQGKTDVERCRYKEDIAGNYERIMLLRRRLSNAADLVWWEPPGKLFLYYLYLYYGKQTINIGIDAINAIEQCPALKTRLQTLYDAPVFRVFQNPDSWTQGTPLSPAFNGTASVTKLREWLKLGW